MNTFHVIRVGVGRVILDDAKPTTPEKNIVQTIKANTWIDAREKVNEAPLYHNPGYGWYER